MKSFAFACCMTILLLLMPTRCIGMITFERTWYWGRGNCFAYNVHQTHDGGYVVSSPVGLSADTSCMALIKTDSLGDTLWVRFYGHGADRTDGGYSCMTRDNGYAILGHFSSQETDWDIVVLRTDSLGDTLWSFVYAGPGLDNGVAIIPTFDRGFAITGHISDASRWACGLMKLDSTGHMSWLRIYEVPGSLGAKGYSVQQMPDSGFVIAGHENDTTHHPWLYLVRTDPQGETLWTRAYDPELLLSIGQSICVTRDSGYAITGIGNDPDTTIHRSATFLMKTNWKGDILWLRRYHGDTVGNLEAYCVRQTADGGFVLVGFTGSHPYPVWLLRTDSCGDSLWVRKFDNLGSGSAFDVQQTRDGGFAISALVHDYYACLIKTDSFGLVSGVAESPPAQSDRLAFSVWPNPFSDRVSFELPVSRARSGKLQILDASGRLVRTLSVEARTVWDATDDNGLLVPRGIYFARLLPDTSATVQKFLLIR
jgi:hypothetical protein